VTNAVANAAAVSMADVEEPPVDNNSEVGRIVAGTARRIRTIERSTYAAEVKGILDDDAPMVSWQDLWKLVATARCQGANNEAAVAVAAASCYVQTVAAAGCAYDILHPLVERRAAGPALKPSTGTCFLGSGGACNGLRRWEARRCCDVLTEGVTVGSKEILVEIEAASVIEDMRSSTTSEEKVTVIVEGPAGATSVSPESPSDEEIVAETAARVPDDTKTARPKAAAEAPGATPVEVNAAEVIPKVKEKGGQARSQGVQAATQEAKLEAEESELLTVVDAGTAAEEEPDGNEAKLTGTITSLEGRVKDSVSGLVVTVTIETVDAEVRVTVVAPLSDTFFITEWPRLAILVWLGG
jgi:hypothetical protein